MLCEGGLVADARVVRILGNEALRARVDHDALDHALGRVDRQDREALVHAHGRRAHAHAHLDADTEIARVRPRRGALVELRRVAAHHLAVVDETAAGEDHAAARPRRFRGPVFGELDACHASVALAHQPLAGHAGHHLHAGSLRRREQRFHHRAPAGVPHHRRHVTARSRTRDVAPRVRQLAAGVIQRGVVVGQLLLLAELLDIAHAVVDHPLEVLETCLAVERDLVEPGVQAARGDDEIVHRLHAVLEAERLLQRRAAAEVAHPARHRRGATELRQALEHQHLGARRARLDGGADGSGPGAGDHHVGAVVPGAHLGAGGGLARFAAHAGRKSREPQAGQHATA